LTGVQRPFAWWVGPGSRPLDLEDRLHDFGVEAKEYELGMALELWDLPPKLENLAELTVRGVTCAEELTDFAGVFAGNWEPPDPAVLGFHHSAAPLRLQDQCPMRLFVGYRDDEAVASSELFLTGRLQDSTPCAREESVGSQVLVPH
jgi:hypothetical protein